MKRNPQFRDLKLQARAYQCVMRREMKKEGGISHDWEETWKCQAFMDGWHAGYRARMQDEAAWREKLIADEQRMKRRKRK